VSYIDEEAAESVLELHRIFDHDSQPAGRGSPSEQRERHRRIALACAF